MIDRIEVTVLCDVCGEGECVELYTFHLGTVLSVLEDLGWTAETDTHLCAECANEADELDEGAA